MNKRGDARCITKRLPYLRRGARELVIWENNYFRRYLETEEGTADCRIAAAYVCETGRKILGRSDETFARRHSSIEVQSASRLLWVRFRKSPAVAAAGL